MQVTIDDGLYQDLVNKVGKANISEYIQAVLRPNLSYIKQQKVDVLDSPVVEDSDNIFDKDSNRTLKKSSSFDEVFGMLKSDKHITIEEMNDTICQRGADL